MFYEPKMIFDKIDLTVTDTRFFYFEGELSYGLDTLECVKTVANRYEVYSYYYAYDMERKYYVIDLNDEHNMLEPRIHDYFDIIANLEKMAEES